MLGPEPTAHCKDASTGAIFPDGALWSRVMPALATLPDGPRTLIVSPLASVASSFAFSSARPTLVDYSAVTAE